MAISYATVLANQSDAYESLGQNEKCPDSLTPAILALDPHGSHPSVQPVLGRLIGLIAISHMHNKLAVTAEGYFRTSIEKLEKSTTPLIDLRC